MNTKNPYIQVADEFLKVAQTLIDKRQWRGVPHAAYYACYQLLMNIANTVPEKDRKIYTAKIKANTRKKLGTHDITIQNALSVLFNNGVDIAELQENIKYLKAKRTRADYLHIHIDSSECEKLYNFAVRCVMFLKRFKNM